MWEVVAYSSMDTNIEIIIKYWIKAIKFPRIAFYYFVVYSQLFAYALASSIRFTNFGDDGWMLKGENRTKKTQTEREFGQRELSEQCFN